ncbi:hypothetical protein [Nonomuraea harbinensis]|uniref:Uncharacterized protein n=1 Tax=Nonomuraea harbinensis TaxID=1286938 RepID=A0ABW1CAU2_9ACTN|nr:hypothetical protein [Nonomuraea harbinensis]
MEASALRVDNSRTTHLAGTSIDRYDVELPAPACHTGIAGWDSRRLRASTAPVNCRRCLRLLERRQTPALLQETIF